MLQTSVHWEPSCYMWTDGQTDLTKLIVTFRNSVNKPKKSAYDYQFQ